MVESQPARAWDEEFDGGDLGCGYLLVDLKLFFDPLPSGRLVRLRWLSEAAPVEIPSWCWLTGHALLQAAHPYYLIRRK
jgi:tRNA 2-thiouridine synthesizing protein A